MRSKHNVLYTPIQLEEATKSRHAVLTVSNVQALETRDAQEGQSTDNSLLHQRCLEKTDSIEGLEACRPSEQALTITNQLGALNAETDC